MKHSWPTLLAPASTKAASATKRKPLIFSRVNDSEMVDCKTLMSTILFLHDWQSVPGGVKPTYLARHGHTVINPALPDEDFPEAVRIAQTEYDRHLPHVVVGSSRGGAVAMNINCGSARLVLLCPALKHWGTAKTVKPGTVILHSRADDVIPFADSEELVRNSQLPAAALIEIGNDHRLADPESLAVMLRACEEMPTEAAKSIAPPSLEHNPIEIRNFVVCSGQYAHSSSDGGHTWGRSLREVPGNNSPVSRGLVNESRLPQLNESGSYDFATVLEDGFGVVAAHENIEGPAAAAPSSLASLFVTHDFGFSWKRLDVPGLSPRGITQGKCSSWPPARFEAMSIPGERRVVLSWQDPWLFDGPMSHVVYSHDGGDSWQYNSLGISNPYLAHDFDGRLLCLNGGYFLLSDDGGDTWRKESFQIEWPAQYRDKDATLLRHVDFPDRKLGYALIVHWSNDMAPAGVGLVATKDNGKIWKHVATLPAPNYGDLNSRHALSLRLG